MLTKVGGRRRWWSRRRRSAGVLIVIQNLPLAIDRRVRMECRALVEAGYHVSVICPRGEGEAKHFQLDGVEVYNYQPPRAASGLVSYLLEFAYCWLRASLLSLKVWRREGFQVLQACNPPDTYWLLGLLWKVRGVRFVYDQHDLCPEVYEARFGHRGALYMALRWLERATYWTADHVISTNQSYRQIAMERGRLSADDLTVVMSAPDPDTMRQGVSDDSLRKGSRYLCSYVGIMGPQDGVDRLLNAIDHYVHGLGRDDCHFALLGFGDCLEDLRRLANELDLEQWVTFTGRVDQAEISRWLSSSDMGVTPDPMCEFNDRSTMNKTLEYMAHGLPQVAFSLTETRRSAGAAAIYVEDDDDRALAGAIAGLLDDPLARDEMGRLGRHRIETSHSWKLQAPGYVAIFDRLTGRKSRAIDLRSLSVNTSQQIDLRETIELPGQRIVPQGLRAGLGGEA